MEFPFLQKTSIWNTLSKFGKSIFVPQGVFYWSARAKKEAEIDATIGTAQDESGMTCHLKTAASLLDRKFYEKVKGHVFSYAPIAGIPSLREKWLKIILRKFETASSSRPATPDRQGGTSRNDMLNISIPIVTSGISYGLAVAGKLFLEANETILIPEKYWENYDQIFTAMQGIKIRECPLAKSNGLLDIEAMRTAVGEILKTQQKLVFLLNFPHNQTGFSPVKEDAERLSKLIRNIALENPGIPIVIILDDAYEGFVYDDISVNASLAPYIFDPLLKNLTVLKLDGISKALLSYGLRIGFITFLFSPIDGVPFNEDDLKFIRKELDDKVSGIIRGEISNSSRLSQAIAEEILDNENYEKELSGTINLLKKRWQIMIEEIQACYKKFGKEKIFVSPFNSGFFCFFNLISEINPEELANKLLKEFKIGVVPNKNGIRVAFCGVPEFKLKTLVNSIFEAVCG